MKIPLSWLREFVDVPGTAEEIAATMSVRGFAAEGIERAGDDTVIDFEVTANRPDCLSVSGMAREVAAAYGLQVRRPAVRGRAAMVSPTGARNETAGADEGAPQAQADAAADAPAPGSGLHLVSLKTVERGEVGVRIDNPELCPRYAGATADVTMGPSPEWMQLRLRAAGVRPINNIVDVTNYVLLELGQPMHAFDLAKIEGGQIQVRTAERDETLRTLDGQQRTLTPDMLVIADGARAVAVAGVMGGADSEVGESTSAILLESANFDPLSVRRTSRKLGLKTEASTRFERGVDPRLPVTALERACALLERIGAGRPHGTAVDCYPVRIEPRQLRLRRARIAGVLGVAVPDADVRRILESLGFALRVSEEGWDVTVPTRRVDVLREADLIEEVARHYGYDRVPVTFPALAHPSPPVDPCITRARQLRTVMTGCGFSEAVTFGFIAAGAASPFAEPHELAGLANPLSETFAVLRPSMLPGLIDAVAYNRRRERRDIRLFEIGSHFSQAAGERRGLAFAWTGAAAAEHWSGGTRDVDVFDVKGVVERLADALRLPVRTVAHAEAWLVPGRSAAVLAGETPVGIFGQLASDVAERHGLPRQDPVYVAEIDLDGAGHAQSRATRYRPLPRFPSVTRDISVLVDASLPAESVRATVHDVAPEILVSVREFDRYQGKGIPEDKVSLSLRLVYRSADRTLTDAEVQEAMDRVLAALTSRHGAVQR